MSNAVRVIGHLGGQAEKKMFGDGGSVVNFSVADKREWKTKGKDGEMEKQSRTIWWNCSSNKAENVREYMLKGTKVMVEGNLDLREWTDKNGMKHISLELWVHTIELLGTKRDNEADAPIVDQETGEILEPAV